MNKLVVDCHHMTWALEEQIKGFGFFCSKQHGAASTKCFDQKVTAGFHFRKIKLAKEGRIAGENPNMLRHTTGGTQDDMYHCVTELDLVGSSRPRPGSKNQ